MIPGLVFAGDESSSGCLCCSVCYSAVVVVVVVLALFKTLNHQKT